MTDVPPTRQSISLCDEFVEVGGDPWAGTYCKLPAGHDGDHSPLYDDEADLARACAQCGDVDCMEDTHDG